jgi:nucleotide-binding universal stress UspA family protein
MGMKNILIPTDFSENSWNAIEYALRFFSKSSCNIYLLHVTTVNDCARLEITQNSSKDIQTEILIKPSKKLLQETLKRIKKLTISGNHKFFTLIDNTYLINSIRKHVIEKRIDLIVMGTKGASRIEKLAIGNNTGDVITKVKCTTLIVPENAKYEKIKEIVFPTDFSIFYHPETLQPIIDIIQENKGTINVLYVNKQIVKLNEDQQKNKEYLDDYFTNYKHSFHLLTNKNIENAVQQFVDDRGINLVTMLAKNLNYFQRILFHPVVNGISYYKNVPFLVLH